jgi:hypothetical protein
MSSNNNYLNYSASNTSNVTDPQATNPPANPPITFSTQPNPSTSGIGTHIISERLVNGNDPAENLTPVDSNMDSGHRAEDSTTNNQNEAQPWAVMTVEYTEDQAVRELLDAFHADAPRRSAVPFTLASSIAPRMTAGDKRELGLEPSLTALGFRSRTDLENGESPNGQLNPTSDISNTTDGVYVSVDPETGCIHGQAEHSNGDDIGNGYGRAQASPSTPMDDALSVKVSDLRVGPVGREAVAELALFSQYPEDEPNRVAPDEGTAASSQTNSTTPVRRRGLIPLLGNENTNHSDEQVLVSPNRLTRPQDADAMSSSA